MPSHNADSEHLAPNVRYEFNKLAHDIEDILHTLGDAADEQTEELKAKARSALNNVRDLELRARSQLHSAEQITQKLVHEHPWSVIVATAVAAYTLGLLTKRRE
ncbi:DUF883 domain-containing protein [Alcaligenaceae bacterium]|nr:DUF883 domain-containing protein [Alcaligenaceae bacterium]